MFVGCAEGAAVASARVKLTDEDDRTIRSLRLKVAARARRTGDWSPNISPCITGSGPRAGFCKLLVRKGGLEPPRYCYRQPQDDASRASDLSITVQSCRRDVLGSPKHRDELRRSDRALRLLFADFVAEALHRHRRTTSMGSQVSASDARRRTTSVTSTSTTLRPSSRRTGRLVTIGSRGCVSTFARGDDRGKR